MNRERRRERERGEKRERETMGDTSLSHEPLLKLNEWWHQSLHY